jgi:thiamine-monophosphate kinase
VDERARIELLRRALAAVTPGVVVGLGDDAAVLRPAAGSLLVWTIDEQVEGVHFRRELASWRDVGWRSFMAAASDVAAMGATPWCALSALVLSDAVDDAALAEIARGQREAADALGAPVVGGNLSRGAAVSITTTLLGACDRAVERRGARAGDSLWLAGCVGLAAAGLRALEQGAGSVGRAGGAADERLATALEAWLHPRALVAEGRAMARVAHAAIDVSDGLACDAGHLADASGVCAVLEEDALLGDASLVAAAAAVGASPLELALHGGEDYALVVATDAPSLPGFRRIGSVREGAGVVLHTRNGERAIEPRGFDHFARR